MSEREDAVEVRVLLFAVAAERAGRRTLTLALGRGPRTAGDVRGALAQAVPALADLLPACALAVDDEYAGDGAPVAAGATVAVIPPVSGGVDGPYARIVTTPIDPAAVAARVGDAASGAVVIFLGTVRAETRGHRTDLLEYESHRSLAEREMGRILSEVAATVEHGRIAAEHRVGRLAVGEVAVVVAASAPHRDGAFAAARAAIDRIKAEVPIWKREIGPDGAEWVEGSALPAAPGG